jgi:uncharacterized membrane protein
MDPIAHLAIATLAFVGGHFVSNTPLRGALVQTIGERGYLGLYSALAFATLGWMIWAYLRAPLEPLWPGLKLVPLAVMPAALVLVAAALSGRNPTAVMQEGALKAAEPARGIIRVTRHPMMWGVMLWAAAHVLARGDVASAIFFGGFFVLAALGTVLIDARKRAALGADWTRFLAVTSNVPFGAIASGRNRVVWGEIGWARIVAGLGLYALVLLAHPHLFGVRAY